MLVDGPVVAEAQHQRAEQLDAHGTCGWHRDRRQQPLGPEGDLPHWVVDGCPHSIACPHAVQVEEEFGDLPAERRAVGAQTGGEDHRPRQRDGGRDRRRRRRRRRPATFPRVGDGASDIQPACVDDAEVAPVEHLPRRRYEDVGEWQPAHGPAPAE